MPFVRNESIPDFVIAGAAKSGTTVLYHGLRQHPQIFMSPLKEPHFFANLPRDMLGPGDRTHTLKKVVRTWDEYLSLFEKRQVHQLCGEASASYLYFSESAVRIKSRNKDAKVIISLRNPVERAFSCYMHMQRDSRETLSFETALQQEEDREAAGWEWSWSYKKVGLYAAQVARYVEVFGRDRVHVLLYDDFVKDRLGSMKAIYRFLGVDETFTPTLRNYNVSGVPRVKWLQRFLSEDNLLKDQLKKLISKGSGTEIKNRVMLLNIEKTGMSSPSRALLMEYFRDDIQRLAWVMGRNLDHWLR
jgi:hypothetical protein